MEVSTANTESLNVEFTLESGIWELLRHEKIPETHVLVTLLTRNACLFNGKKKISCLSGTNSLFQILEIPIMLFF